MKKCNHVHVCIRQNSHRLAPVALALSLAFSQGVLADASSKKNTAPLKPDVPYIFVVHNGRSIKVERDIDQSFRARVDIRGQLYQNANTCPPFCLKPMQLNVPVETIGEAEIIDFMMASMRENTGVLVDARHPNSYNKSTIPGSINLFIQDLMKAAEGDELDAIFESLGAEKREQPGWFTGQLETYGLAGDGLRKGEWDFTEAKDLVIWSTSAMDRTSESVIRIFLDAGYPASKLKWYRGGMASWQYWGFSTVGTPKR